jgi:Spy/CpxP family protein refolding chaperone
MKANLFSFPVLLAALLISAIGARDILAQEDSPERRQRREQVETVIIGKFATELELTPEQAERFFPLFREFRQSSHDIFHNQHRVREQLDSISTGTESAQLNVSNLIEQQGQYEQQALRLRTDFLKSVEGILTPQQVSRCSVLLDELPAKMRELIHQQKRREHENDSYLRKSR